MGDIKFYSPVDFDDTSSGVTIEGDIQLGSFNKISGADSDNLVIAVDTGNTSGGSSIDFQVDGANSAMFINNSRNVGIGTTSPSYKLHVNGNIWGNFIFTNEFSVGNEGKVVSTSSQGLQLQATAGSKPITFFTNVGGNTERMRISYDGNVGIGTTSPSEKLHVDGNARITGAIYDSNNSPGTSGQILSSTATGIDWIDNLSTATSAEKVSLEVRYDEAVSKGDPVYVSGFHGSSGPVIVSKSRSDDSAKMPAFGLADDDYAQNATGHAISLGNLDDIDTDSYSIGDTLYVAPTGGLTDTKPTGSNLIQNVGTVSRSNANNGSIEVTATGRSNDVPNLTTGKIWVGDSNTTESTVVHLDETNGRMGIGTTSPAYKLDVSGNIRVDSTSAAQIFLDSAASNDAVLNFQENAAQKGKIGYDTSLSGIAFVAGSGAFSSADMVVLDSGNVGVGTTSPSVKFEVNGGADAIAKITGTTTAARFDYVTNSHHRFWQIIESDGRFRFYDQTNSAERFNITSSGNVGIGTTSPSQKLHVSGGNAIIDGGTSNYLYLNTTANYFYGDVNGVGILAAGDNLRIKTDGSERVRITSNGNVGIGTTSPLGRLHIYQPSGAGSFILSRSNNITGVNFQLSADSTKVRLSGYGDALTFLTATAGTGTNASEKMRITSAGNVGIGTTSPSEKLDVAGSALINGTIYSGDGSISTSNSLQLQYNAVSGDGVIASKSTGGNTTLALQTSDSGATATKLYITSAGNVGIGTTSPGAKLDISDSIPTLRITGTRDASWTIGQTIASLEYFSKDSSGSAANSVRASINLVNETSVFGSTTGLAFSTKGDVSGAPSEAMRINASGNVGIGTTSPQFQLHVNSDSSGASAIGVGNTGSGMSRVYLDASNGDFSGSDYMWIGQNNDLTGEIFMAQNAGSFYIKTQPGGTSTVQLAVTQAGQVGIGTTSPGYKLDVTGDSTSGVIAVRNSANGRDTFRSENAAGTRTVNIGNDANGHGIVLVRGAGGTTNNYIAGNGNSYFNAGNIGIGTTSPEKKLDVRGDVQIHGGATATNVQEVGFKNTYNTALLRSSYTNPSQTTETYLAFHTNTALTSNGTVDEQMRIAGNKVGIGTTSPTAKLHVQYGSGGSDIVFSANGKVVMAGDGTLRWGSAADYGKLTWDTGKAVLRGESGKALSLGANGTQDTIYINTSQNVGIGTSSPSYKLTVSDGINAGGVVTYSKNYSSLDTTGNAVAGLTTGYNGASAGFTFTCFGHSGGYQKIVYSCYNGSGTWVTEKVIDEGTNDFDVEASANATTITFTFKSTSGTKSYTPKVTVEATGTAINSTYA